MEDKIPICNRVFIFIGITRWNYAAGARNFCKMSEAMPDKGNLATSPGRVIFGGKLSTADG
jgi:hypothetical protein